MPRPIWPNPFSGFPFCRPGNTPPPPNTPTPTYRHRHIYAACAPSTLEIRIIWLSCKPHVLSQTVSNGAQPWTKVVAPGGRVHWGLSWYHVLNPASSSPVPAWFLQWGTTRPGGTWLAHQRSAYPIVDTHHPSPTLLCSLHLSTSLNLIVLHQPCKSLSHKSTPVLIPCMLSHRELVEGLICLRTWGVPLILKGELHLLHLKMPPGTRWRNLGLILTGLHTQLGT